MRQKNQLSEVLIDCIIIEGVIPLFNRGNRFASSLGEGGIADDSKDLTPEKTELPEYMLATSIDYANVVADSYYAIISVESHS